jgi:hypothetical protein
MISAELLALESYPNYSHAISPGTVPVYFRGIPWEDEQYHLALLLRWSDVSLHFAKLEAKMLRFMNP